MATSTTNRDRIREHMPVQCADGERIATVDRVEGNAIKLTKDDRGAYHWIPLDWVTRVDERVHIDRPGEQARREWLATAPEWETSAPAPDAVNDWRDNAGGAAGSA